jgi:FAD/FMN-containing dehydrogenase
VRSIDLVTAGGKFITASERDHGDLLWALRGGGGNFGVATSFEYQLHPMDPVVYGGVIAWPFAQAREVLSFYADFAARAPDELNLDVLGIWSPQGEPLIALEACWSADHAKGEQVLKPVRVLGRPVFDQIGAMPYLQLQTSTDAPLAAGSRYYSKSGFFNGMTPQIIDAIVNAFGQAEPRSMAFLMQHSGGAVGRVPVTSTAFPNRSARHWLMLSSSWKDPTLDDAKFAAVRAAWKNIEPLTHGFYVNVMAEEEHSRVAANYGANYRRLREIKLKYDPANQFRLNANIEPAA